MTAPPAQILVVDDRPENRLSLNAVLARPGLVIHEAGSGEEALRMLVRQRFACVLLDVQMPGMDGFEVARLMRGRRSTADIPILFVTAYSREETAVFEGYESGAVDYLFKPVQPKVVRSKVAVFVRLEQQRQELLELAATLEGRVAERTAELARAEARYRALVEQMPGVVYVARLGLRDRFEFISPQIGALTGLPAERWWTEPDLWWSQVHAEDRAGVEAGLARAAAAGGPFRLEYRLQHQTGDYVWVRDEGRVELREGADPRVRGLLVDITEARDLRRQVEQAQKIESVGQLAGGIAHDFNNLLSVVLGFAGLARDAVDPVERDQALDRVQKAAERGASLTRRLLSFARQQAVRPRTLEAGSELAEVTALLRRVLPDSVELSYEAPLEPLWIDVDPVHFEQVVINLSLNARDALPNGGQITVRLGLRELPQPLAIATGSVAAGSWVVLGVADEGTGMDEATRSRIFEPFFTTKEPGKGTGLGLASCLGIVQRSSGQIDVASQLGQGTRFEIWLPSAAPPPQALRPAAAVTEVTGSERVLLVEDDAMVRELVAAALARFGYCVQAASGGEEALALVDSGLAFDLLLTDMTMPGMQGTDVIEAIRSRRPNLPAILLSGRAAPSALEALPEVVYLQKPVRPERLAAAVRASLDGLEVDP